MKKVFFFLIIFSFVSMAISKNKDETEIYYKSALASYEKGSYYSALEDIQKVISYPKSKNFKDALLLTAKIYLEIGKKTGLKKYLWRANYYLNMYIQAGGKQSSDYYYTKAGIFERLNFFERAFTLYKMALMKNNDEKIGNRIILGLMRTAIMVGNLDAISRYMIYLAPMTYSESKELTFLVGMKYFYEGNYKLALDIFKEVYRDFELYLLDNPDFYFYVGETAFLNGEYNFAKKIFRKIISQVKNDDVIRKSYLRLGDIALIEKDKNEAFNNYLIVINRFPETEENTVARLKMLSLLEFYPQLKSKVTKIDKLKDPIAFTVRTLISNRTNYIGKYAIGNFGVLVFKNPTDYLLNRLSWELSIMYPLLLTPDQKLYINTLWTPYLDKIEDSKLVTLYDANPSFFKEIFDRKILKRISNVFDMNQKFLNQNISLLKYLIRKYEKDEDKRYLAFIYYKLGNNDAAATQLNSIKDKTCQDIIFINIIEKKPVSKLVENCDITELPKEIKVNYLLTVYRETKNKKLIQQLTEILKKNDDWKLTNFVKDQIYQISTDLFKEKDYKNIVSLLEPIYQDFINDSYKCDILSILLISKIRTSDTSKIDEIYDKIKECKIDISVVAKEIYKNLQLQKEVK